ncbi:MAG: DUF928 domain-containing protein [Methylococcaceae bacterium]
MKSHITWLVVIGLITLSSNGFAEQGKGSISQKNEQYNKEEKERKRKKKPDSQNNLLQKLSYSAPPFLGAPSQSRLVGMALRGGGANDFLLSVLTPAHTGLSLKAQPDIFWYTSQPISKPFHFVEFVLNSDKAIKPILRTHLVSPKKAGVQKISLSDYNIELEPDTEYTWSISLVPDPASRSHDFVTSGKIKYVKGNDVLLNTIKTTSLKLQANLYATEGYWYDAVASIIRQTKQHPEDQSFRNNLSALINQVGLYQIAKKIDVSI